MSINRKCLMAVMVTAVLGILLWGTGFKKSGKESSNDERTGKTVILLCIKCGQIKSSELCCKPDQIKCPKCGLTKGSPGCCKIPEGAQIAAFCTECDKVIVNRVCYGCYTVKCPIEEFVRTHRYPCPK